MPINPLQFTQPQAYSGGMDFSPLSKLGEIYLTAQTLGNLGDDPIANRQALMKSGVPSLAQAAIGMQDKEILRRREDIAREQAQANWIERMKLEQAQGTRAQSAEERAQRKEAQDTPEGREASIIAAGMDPKDPNVRAHIATGSALPTPLALEKEAREKIKFEQEQKYSTREARLAAVKNPEAGLDINEPEIRRWVALGGEIPDAAKNRLGLGAPIYMRDAEGNLKAYQLSATGTPVEIKAPGQTVLGPGEIAQQKAEGGVTGKAVGKAVLDLPKIEADANLVTKTIDKALAPHEGKSWSVGTMFKDAPALPGSKTADYRAILDQLDSQTFLDAYNSLRGGGHISDYEDKRASGAKARLGRAQSVKEFDNALLEYKEIIQSGVASARRTAARSVMGGGSPASAPAAAKPDPLGLR
jgi:hypothetical protein